MSDKPKKLTIKQKKFVKAYVETGDKSVAYKEAYDTKGNPETVYPEAVRTASLPQVKEAIEQAMVKLNLTPERALMPVDEALSHNDLDMRLKGHDRYMKLVNLTQGKTDTGNTFNFIKADNANFNAGKYVD